MPLHIKEKVAAGLILSTGVFLAESLSCISTQNDFEFTSLEDPRAIPFWLLQNGVLFIGHNAPKSIILFLQFLLPLISLYIIMDKEMSPDPQQRVGNNRHALFNSELNQFNPYLDSFIEKMSKRESFKSQLEKLVLTEDEKKKLEVEEFADCITDELMEIPVSVYGKNYNLDTILSLNPKKDPHTRFPFTLRDIQPMQEIAEKIKTLISDFHKAREQPSSRVAISVQ
ncbi:MAG: hypothetical protein P4L65_06590 [Legionella sp.]|nr:hypothetical protein [Legionella sp.]